MLARLWIYVTQNRKLGGLFRFIALLICGYVFYYTVLTWFDLKPNLKRQIIITKIGSHLSSHDNSTHERHNHLLSHDGAHKRDNHLSSHDDRAHERDNHLSSHDDKAHERDNHLSSHDDKAHERDNHLSSHDDKAHERDNHLSSHDDKAHERDNHLSSHDDRAHERDNHLSSHDVEHTNSTEMVNNQQTTVSPLDVSNNTKNILLWTSFYQLPFFGFGSGRTGFEKYKCRVGDCTLTNDKNDLDSADAVLFHVPDIDKTKLMPKHGAKPQVFVFLIYESPMSTNPRKITNLSDYFNLTITYMRSEETDVTVPYGTVLPIDETQRRKAPSLALVKQKSKSIAWLVSDCRATSCRNEYVEQLSKYIQVDIYGKCGNYSCPKGNATCFNAIVKDYMFMLAFENSYCQDYATEKLYRSLKHDIVPITLGRSDYSSLLPDQSFIDTKDFNSPKHLAEHLLSLMEHRDQYLEYLKWKDHYMVAERLYTRPKAFCDLCKILHTKHYQYKTHFDPSVYWSKESNCLVGEAEKQQTHLT